MRINKIAILILTIVSCASYLSAQPVTQLNNVYFPVYTNIPYQNKAIPGLVQEIPIQFKDVISLHQIKLDLKGSQLDKLAKDMENSLSINPQNDILILKQAILYYEAKKIDKAENIFENLVDRSAKPQIKEDSFFYLGLIAGQRNAYKESKYYFERVIELDKKRTNAYINLGIAYFFLNEYKKATDAF